MESQPVSVTAVGLKLPPFWSMQPQTWFAQTEAQFELRAIKADETKYSYVVASLEQESARRITDLLENPPTTNRYKTIKQRLLSTFGLSEQERATRLFNMPGLGDKKPSQLMDEMLALLQGHTPCFLFRHLYMSHLPEEVRVILAQKTELTDPRELAKAADDLWLAQGDNALAVASVNQYHQRKNRSQSVPKPGELKGTRRREEVCFYHKRFGNRARQCQPPCKFSGN